MRALDFCRQETFLLEASSWCAWTCPTTRASPSLQRPAWPAIRCCSNCAATTAPASGIRQGLAAGHRLPPSGAAERALPAAVRADRDALAGRRRDDARHVLVNLNDNVDRYFENGSAERRALRAPRVVTPFARQPGRDRAARQPTPRRPAGRAIPAEPPTSSTPTRCCSAAPAATGARQQDPAASFDASGMRAEQLFAQNRGHACPTSWSGPKGARPTPTTDAAVRLRRLHRSNPGIRAAWARPGFARRRAGGGQHPAAAASSARWHQAAQRENNSAATTTSSPSPKTWCAQDHQRAPRHRRRQQLGGLLVGAVMVQRPELFNAVVCRVPLLDMRFHKLLAGARLDGRYGNPDKPEDWAVISRYSPTQGVKRDGGYPRRSSPPRRATTACTRAMRARWWRMARTGPADLYTRTSGAATAARHCTYRGSCTGHPVFALPVEGAASVRRSSPGIRDGIYPSRSCSSRHITLPEPDLGRLSTNSTILGAFGRPPCARAPRRGCPRPRSCPRLGAQHHHP